MTDLNPTPVPVTVPDPKRPWKALVPIALGIIYTVWQAIEVALGDNEWSEQDTLTVIGALITALLVYFVPNPPAPID
jgi:hypothetical protein